MVDPNMKNFYGRVDRIQRVHAAGGGFEAQGTLGMFHYNALRKKRRRATWLMPALLVCVTVLLIKAGVMATIGPELYQDRIAMLQQGNALDRAGAYVLEAGQATVWLSEIIRGVIR
ncbi:hypothetical protein OEW28_04855 [Defluviimonas sp. WL0002]|uniref:Uncharacterized protein n=1 Tax=Albidovulum marisflavi TaxID=2984159 RepID=A0ABT2Z9Z2_9RHOB|nr:hypothetical protein [Defluviimonas sp. WL0002]MCV2867949.1 hypothetical protein [Defluviimonas sp. WL0002]